MNTCTLFLVSITTGIHYNTTCSITGVRGRIIKHSVLCYLSIPSCTRYSSPYDGDRDGGGGGDSKTIRRRSRSFIIRVELGVT